MLLIVVICTLLSTRIRVTLRVVLHYFNAAIEANRIVEIIINAFVATRFAASVAFDESGGFANAFRRGAMAVSAYGTHIPRIVLVTSTAATIFLALGTVVRIVAVHAVHEVARGTTQAHTLRCVCGDQSAVGAEH